MNHQRVTLSSVCRQERLTVKPGERDDLRYIGLESIEAGTGLLVEGELSKTPDAPQANSFQFGPQHVLYGKLRPYLNKILVPTFEGKCSTEIVPLLPSADLDRRYLAFFLRNTQTVARISEKTSGARMPRANMGFVLGMKLPLPPLTEQRRIVDLLSRAEGILRLRREAQAKTQAIIPALFLDMFGDPAMNPKGWPVHPLGDLLAESPTLGTMAKPSPTAARWLDLRVANIQDGQLTLRDKRWLDLEPNQIERFALRDGDLLLARAIGSLDHLGKAVIVHPTGPWTFDSHLMRIRVNRGMLLPEYLKSLLESKSGRTEFLKHTRHSAVQYNINGKEIRRLTIPVPPIDMQINFQERRRVVLGLAFQQVIALKKSQAIFEGLLDSTLN